MHLMFTYLGHKKKFKREQKKNGEIKALSTDLPPEKYPLVTVQLPVYNELYVVERLIDSVCAFNYPKDRFEIQVLDDSDDESVELIAARVKEWQAKGLQIQHVRRPTREGFKAGALQYGMGFSKGEFIAIFDADFMPEKDFLLRTLVHFSNDNIGLVQTRWQHMNEDYSLLTRLQAFALDAHFSVEQKGRNAGGYFMNFNGTAGVWRRTCIDDAGGWHSDTLTEDLDLSYRAQLKGWRFNFIEQIQSPSELPMVMNAIKSQQFRWTKGAAEVARKNLWKVLRAKLPLGIKVHATFHLLNSLLFICILATGVLSVPLLVVKANLPELNDIIKYASVFMLSLLILILFYYVARRETKGAGVGKALKFVGMFPIFLSVSMGMSLHNAIATLEGYLGFKSPFIRTPKYNVNSIKENWRTRTKYLSKKLSFVTWMEGLLSLYFLVGGIGMGIWYGDYGFIPFHTLLFFGYGVIFYYSIRHAIASS